MPKYLSSDHDPLYRFHQWQANLQTLEVKEIKTVPYVPLSHPFVERLIGIRREYLDQMLFWTAVDLENKLLDFGTYFNSHRNSYLVGRANAGYARVTTNRQSPLVWMATALSYIRRRWLRDFQKTLPAQVPMPDVDIFVADNGAGIQSNRGACAKGAIDHQEQSKR